MPAARTTRQPITLRMGLKSFPHAPAEQLTDHFSLAARLARHARKACAFFKHLDRLAPSANLWLPRFHEPALGCLWRRNLLPIRWLAGGYVHHLYMIRTRSVHHRYTMSLRKLRASGWPCGGFKRLCPAFQGDARPKPIRNLNPSPPFPPPRGTLPLVWYHPGTFLYP
jgi:hypothetical protein